MAVIIQPISGDISLAFDVDDPNAMIGTNLISRVKGGVMGIVDNKDGNIQILVEHEDSFEWIDLDMCIPASSEREYEIEEPEGPAPAIH